MLAESRDDSRTWGNERLLEQDSQCGYCYCSLFFLSDALLLGYCCGGRDGLSVLQASRLCRLAR